jgi:S1-C subfamily serine protease
MPRPVDTAFPHTPRATAVTGAALLAGLVFALPAAADPTVATPLMAADAQWRLVGATVRVASGPGRPPFGTAVCVGSRGGADYLLTAAHVVPKGEARSYESFARDGFPRPAAVRLDAEVILRLPECDLALVKIAPAESGLRVVPLATLAERPRRFPAAALAVGCEMGDPPAVRVVRLTGRQLVRRPEGNAVFWVAAEAPRGGMSGGPLVDTAGRLIGICVAAQGGGYYAHADEILAALKRHGYGWLAERPAAPTVNRP